MKNSRYRLITIALCAALMLSACGDGFTPAKLQVDCIGSSCGAVGSTYTGRGVGIWTYTNDRNRPQVLDIALDGLNNNTVTIVFSNIGSAEATLEGDLTSRITLSPPISPPLLSPGEDILPATPYPLDTSAETHIWKVPQFVEGEQAPARAFGSTLRAQAVFDGFRYRIWVADDQWTPHMQAQLPKLAAVLFGVPEYTGLLRQYLDAFHAAPWGDYPVNADNMSQLPHGTRDIDFVFAPNGAGDVQFFDASQTRVGQESNRALVMFVGTKGLACTDIPAGLCVDSTDPLLTSMFVNTLLHEFTHLVHNYQRGVRRGPKHSFDRWLKEAVAASQGFMVAQSRFPIISPSFFEIAPWFAGKYACSLISAEGEVGTSLSTQCAQNYYSSGQAFLIYLANRYGTDFYQNLLTADGTSIDALDSAIRTSGGIGFADSFRRWGGMLALLPKDAPSGYSYSGTSVSNFTFPALDGAAFAALRRLPQPVTGPVRLAPYSHRPLVDVSQKNHYQRQLVIPPDVAVTVYVQ